MKQNFKKWRGKRIASLGYAWRHSFLKQMLSFWHCENWERKNMHFIVWFCLLYYLYWLFLTEVILWVLHTNLKNVKKTSGSNLWKCTEAATNQLIWGFKWCPRNLNFVGKFYCILFNQLMLFYIFNTVFWSVRNAYGMNTWWISSEERQPFMISK